MNVLTFMQDVERLPESRRLELNGYLTKPTTRLARYPLLLQQVIKYTPEGNPDKQNLEDVIKVVKQFLSRVNEETGKSEDRFQMASLSDLLSFKPGEEVDLRLKEEGRELVFKGPLKRRGGSGQGETAELQAYLFDHAFIVVKPKIVHKMDILKVNRRPIPLELLVCTIYEDIMLPSTSSTSSMGPSGSGSAAGSASGTGTGLAAGGAPQGKPSGKLKTLTTRMSTGTRLTSILAQGAGPKQDSKAGFPMRFTWLGRKGYSMTLWASTYAGRKKWFEHVDEAQSKLRKRSNIFNTMTLGPVSAYSQSSSNSGAGGGTGSKAGAGGTSGNTQVHLSCCAPFDFGRRVIYGSMHGVFLSELRKDARPPTKVLPLMDVTQIEVLEEYQILLILADKTLWTFTLDGLDPTHPKDSLRMGRRIQGTVHFFCSGRVNDKMLVCAVKSSAVSSTIRLFEPLDTKARYRGAGTRRRPVSLQWAAGGATAKGQDSLRIFKDFYVSTESSSAVFLKNRLCLICAKGFEIVDIDTLDTQGILDATDPALDFLTRGKEKDSHTIQPLAIYLIHGEFLLCYTDFAFYVNRFGRRVRPEWAVVWEGQPLSFALSYPYLLAFDPNFVEVRHVKTGALHQILTGSRLRCLFADPTPYVPSKKELQLQQQQQQQQQHVHEVRAPVIYRPSTPNGPMAASAAPVPKRTSLASLPPEMGTRGSLPGSSTSPGTSGYTGAGRTGSLSGSSPTSHPASSRSPNLGTSPGPGGMGMGSPMWGSSMPPGRQTYPPHPALSGAVLASGGTPAMGHGKALEPPSTPGPGPGWGPSRNIPPTHMMPSVPSGKMMAPPPYLLGPMSPTPLANGHSPMWESAFASRNNILLQGDNAIYALRPAGAGTGLLEPLTLAHHSGPLAVAPPGTMGPRVVPSSATTPSGLNARPSIRSMLGLNMPSPGQTSMQPPLQPPFQAPLQTPLQAPSQAASHATGQAPGQVPGQVVRRSLSLHSIHSVSTVNTASAPGTGRASPGPTHTQQPFLGGLTSPGPLRQIPVTGAEGPVYTPMNGVPLPPAHPPQAGYQTDLLPNPLPGSPAGPPLTGRVHLHGGMPQPGGVPGTPGRAVFATGATPVYPSQAAVHPTTFAPSAGSMAVRSPVPSWGPGYASYLHPSTASHPAAHMAHANVPGGVKMVPFGATQINSGGANGGIGRAVSPGTPGRRLSSASTTGSMTGGWTGGSPESSGTSGVVSTSSIRRGSQGAHPGMGASTPHLVSWSNASSASAQYTQPLK